MPTVHPQVQKARDLMPLVAAASDEHDEIRNLTKPVVKALVDGGFFTMLKMKSVGGMELKPSIFARVTEALANADGSTGWVVCQSNGCSTTSAYMSIYAQFSSVTRYDMYSMNILDLHRARTTDGILTADTPNSTEWYAQMCHHLSRI
jgi:hypothetical protein